MTAQPRAVLVEWIAGACWKCEGSGLLVTWVGPAQVNGQYAPIYLCQSCLAAVERRTLRHFMDHYLDAPAAVVARPYYPPPHPERPPMHSSPPARPVPVVSISVTAFGFRASADGRTGREAWRTIRKRHPRVTWAVGAYALLLFTVLGTVAAARLVT
ncbi:hypothetical protein [Streptomyces misionensis]|uniref:hypothetical protein n=1 Tax=Streptomyces misionensis TaxID=67331 RepID=UPI0036D0DEDF